MTINTDKLAGKIAKFVALLGSPHDQEAIAAARKLAAALTAGRMSFDTLAERMGLPEISRPLFRMANAEGEAAVSALTEARRIVAEAKSTFTMLAPRTKKAEAGKRKAPMYTPSGERILDLADPDDLAEYLRRAQAHRKATRAARAPEREAVIRRYGSEAAAAETARERALRAATAPLQRELEQKFSNGTFSVSSLDGWTSDIGEAMPDSVRTAVLHAYPAPTSVAEAFEEYEWWNMRWRELDLVVGYGCRDFDWDLACDARRQVVHDMVRKEEVLPSRTVADIEARLLYAIDTGNFVDAPFLSDILTGYRRVVVSPPVQIGRPAKMDQNEPRARPKAPPVQSGQPRPERASDRRARVRAMVRDAVTGAWSDRRIATAAGVSPTTVGRLRREILLDELLS